MTTVRPCGMLLSMGLVCLMQKAHQSFLRAVKCSAEHSCLCGAQGWTLVRLLARIGISVNATNEKVGTVAIAYAAHKALSPVRFPPTVALTPVVARLLGRGKDEQQRQRRRQRRARALIRPHAAAARIQLHARLVDAACK